MCVVVYFTLELRLYLVHFKALAILPVVSDIPTLPDAVKSCVFTDIRQEWNAPTVVQFALTSTGH